MMTNSGLPIIRTHGVKGVNPSWLDKPVTNERDFLSTVWQVSQMREAPSNIKRHFLGMQKWHKMGVGERERATEAMSPIAPGASGRKGTLVATIPVTILSGMLHFNPNLIADESAFDALLLQFPELAAPDHLEALQRGKIDRRAR